MRKPLLIILCIILAPVAAYVLYGASLWLFGYELTGSPQVLAQKLITEVRPAKDCYLFRTLDLLMRPTTAELQMRCVRDYAEKKQDPSACELLLPTEYGMACLSTLGGKLFSGNHCTGTYGRNEVYCSSYSNGGEQTIERPQIKDCLLYKRKDIQEWCYKERTSILTNVHDCKKIANEIEVDDCENAYAFKQKDPSLCTAVKDEKRRLYCEIRINTWLKNPKLRGSFYFGRSVPID